MNHRIKEAYNTLNGEWPRFTTTTPPEGTLLVDVDGIFAIPKNTRGLRAHTIICTYEEFMEYDQMVRRINETTEHLTGMDAWSAEERIMAEYQEEPKRSPYVGSPPMGRRVNVRFGDDLCPTIHGVRVVYSSHVGMVLRFDGDSEDTVYEGIPKDFTWEPCDDEETMISMADAVLDEAIQTDQPMAQALWDAGLLKNYPTE